MGNYFMMSFRFNKHSAQDFGLVELDANSAIDPVDNQLWKKISLYNFGWGSENGFYKAPMLEFEELFDLTIHSTLFDDVYGAASVILNDYPDQLLEKCESIISNEEFHLIERLSKIYDLSDPINRSSILFKSFEQINSEHERWENISLFINKYLALSHKEKTQNDIQNLWKL